MAVRPGRIADCPDWDSFVVSKGREALANWSDHHVSGFIFRLLPIRQQAAFEGRMVGLRKGRR